MPRRYLRNGTDIQAGSVNNMRVRKDGTAVLAGKNKMDNIRMNEFDQDGNLMGWTLDNPPEEVKHGVYGRGPGFPNFTRQGELEFIDPFFSMRGPLIVGEPPPDPTHRSAVAPFSLPPMIELVSNGQIGFAEGWWPVTHAYLSLGTTNAGPWSAIFLNQGQIMTVFLDEQPPEGVLAYLIGIGEGPFLTENAAMNATTAFLNATIPTMPKLPFSYDIKQFKKGPPMSFIINTTKIGEGRDTTKPKTKTTTPTTGTTSGQVPLDPETGEPVEDTDGGGKSKPKHKKKKKPGRGRGRR